MKQKIEIEIEINGDTTSSSHNGFKDVSNKNLMYAIRLILDVLESRDRKIDKYKESARELLETDS